VKLLLEPEKKVVWNLILSIGNWLYGCRLLLRLLPQ